MIAIILKATICTKIEQHEFEDRDNKKVSYQTIGIRQDEFENVFHFVLPKKYAKDVEARIGEVAQQIVFEVQDDKKLKIKQIEY